MTFADKVAAITRKDMLALERWLEQHPALQTCSKYELIRNVPDELLPAAAHLIALIESMSDVEASQFVESAAVWN